MPRHHPRTDSSSDSGSATIWAAALAALCCCAFAAVLAVGSAVVARHRAASAADLAALAAADRLLLDPGASCARAAWIAAAQHTRLLACTVGTDDGRQDSVDVETEARAAGPFALLLPPARSRARAGPVTADALAQTGETWPGSVRIRC